MDTLGSGLQAVASYITYMYAGYICVAIWPSAKGGNMILVPVGVR